jgi:DNA-binding MarR family transcriptional regulator
MVQSSGDDRVDLFRLLVALGIRMRSRMDRRLAEVGLTTQQAAVVTIVEAAEDPPSIEDVRRVLGTTHQNTRQIVESLRRKRLLVVEPDPDDRRARRLIVGPALASTFAAREASDREAVRAWTAALDDDEAAVVVRLLARLVLDDGAAEDDQQDGPRP